MTSEQNKKPSLLMSGRESYHRSNRRIVVVGPSGTGKTTFSVSGSKFAGDKITGEVRECKDVLMLQGDAEGAMGAEDAGLMLSYVLDLSTCQDWSAYYRKVCDGLTEAKPLIESGELRIIVVDLALPQRLIEEKVKPQGPEGWGQVRTEGMKLYNLFSRIQGVTVIGNAQVKSTTVMAKKTQLEEATEKAAITAIGGELSNFQMDLAKGVASLWKENASFILCREARRKRAEDGTETKEYWTHTQSSRKFEAKSRATSRLPARIKGDVTLNYILRRIYGQPEPDTEHQETRQNEQENTQEHAAQQVG